MTDPVENTKNYNALERAEQTLPISWYFDAEHYQRELAAIWSRHWVYLCRGEKLDRPGAFRTISIGDQNIFVVRTDENSLAGFFNTCRHRGSLLLCESEGRLKSRSITCPYHRWTYAADDGRLIGTSSFAEPDGFDRNAHGLFPVALTEWRGFVFVNLDCDAVWDAAEVFDHGLEEIGNFPLEDLVTGHSWTKHLACNWKTFWDNYGECLHCPGVHPSLSELVPIFKRGLLSAKDAPDWQDNADNPDPAYRGGLRPGAETYSNDGSAQGYLRTDGLTREDIARGVTYAGVLPSVYFAAHPDHARIVRVLPRGPESIELTVEWFFHRDALEDPDYDISNVTEFAQTILEEDGTACELNQQGMHSMPMNFGVLMPEEYELRSYRDWVLAALDK